MYILDSRNLHPSWKIVVTGGIACFVSSTEASQIPGHIITFCIRQVWTQVYINREFTVPETVGLFCR